MLERHEIHEMIKIYKDIRKKSATSPDFECQDCLKET